MVKKRFENFKIHDLGESGESGGSGMEKNTFLHETRNSKIFERGSIFSVRTRVRVLASPIFTYLSKKRDLPFLRKFK